MTLNIKQRLGIETIEKISTGINLPVVLGALSVRKDVSKYPNWVGIFVDK
jgi:hypothetical protein